MTTIIKKYSFGEVIIIKFEDEIAFNCNSIGLDAIYNIKNSKIKGKGSKACKDYILNEVNNILK